MKSGGFVVDCFVGVLGVFSGLFVLPFEVLASFVGFPS